jgi:endonuclease-3
VARVARAIRTGGLARQKAPRIKAILRRLHRQRGELSLDFLHDLPSAEAFRYLRAFAGVGPKTAACVLLFACDKPVLPVDTHVHRVSRRLGLIGPRTSAEKAHEELARLTAPGKVLEFHVQLIRHGRRVCTARDPRCTDCVLLDGCPFGQERMGAAPAR